MLWKHFGHKVLVLGHVKQSSGKGGHKKKAVTVSGLMGTAWKMIRILKETGGSRMISLIGELPRNFSILYAESGKWNCSKGMFWFMQQRFNFDMEV